MNKFVLIKKLAVLVVVCSVISTSGIAVYADSGYTKATGTAGSTSVTAEVGFNGQTGYASVTAGDYVDVSFINGDAFYIYGDKYFSQSFDQRTYCEVSVTCPNDICTIGCTVKVYSDDGEWSTYIYAN